MIIFYATKACQDEKWYWKMQEYHLRLAFYLSKAETVLRIQTKEMENLTSCYYVAPKSNIFVQYIPLVRFLVFLRAFTRWTPLPTSKRKLCDAIFQFLLYFLGLTPIMLWFVLGLISKMIRRREENEIKRRFSIDGRKFGFSLFSALKRLCIFLASHGLYHIGYIIWPISYRLYHMGHVI